MKKCELLAPAGSLESLYAAISNGATSVYFGGSNFNARMYAQNFTNDDIKTAISYAHQRNVKVFITLNILIKDEEINDVLAYIDELYLLGIDGIIVQDYAMINIIKETYPDLILSCSTQTTIDDLESALYFQNLGVNRIVLARECDFETIKKIKENTNLEVEVFAHGALCVCYSGQCLMSSFIGDRSGNRGKCAQPCRKKYTLINETLNQKLDNGNDYILSLKDLNTSFSLNKLLDINIDSLKLEGRMKNPEYVSNITRSYRSIIDSYYSNSHIDLKNINHNLEKTFHRTFTKGYIFKDEIKNMNASKNNVGYLIGKVTNPNYKGYIEITLNEELSQNDIIRFDSKDEVTSKLVRLYDSNLKLTNKCIHKAYIKLNERIPLNTLIFKTFDYNYDLELKKSFPKDNYKLPLDVEIIAKINQELNIKLSFDEYFISYSLNKVNIANNAPLSEEKIINQINKLNDTPFFLNNIKVDMDDNIYINIKELNELRRTAINMLLNKMALNLRKSKEYIYRSSLNNKKEEPKLTFKVHTLDQYNYIKSLGYSDIYYDNNSTLKVNNDYNIDSNIILAKNYGSLYSYYDKELIIDYSLNVYNHLSTYYFIKNGAKRVTPSLELSTNEYLTLAKNYYNYFNEFASLEFVAYTTPELMVSKFCPLRTHNQCGKCHNYNYLLKDDFDTFHLYTDNKCHMHLLSTKKVNKLKDISKVKEYSSAIRLEFFNESNEEIKKIIDEANHQLSI